MRAMVLDLCRWSIAVAVAARPAVAQRAPSILIEADGVVNIGFSQTTRSTFLADPNAEPGDVPATSVSQAFTELRPAITFQGGSPRVTWRAGYTFSANINPNDGTTAYSSSANAALVSELSPAALLTFTAAISQGGTAFQLSGGAAQDGQPQIRAQGNPALVTGTLGEALTWQLGRQLALRHNLNATVSAPQDALAERNSALSATLGLERLFTRDAVGLDLHLGIAWLQVPQAAMTTYASVTNTLLGRWNRDFSPAWNALVTAGVEQVFTDTGSRPLAFLPTGSVAARYTAGATVTALEVSHGSATNLSVGAVSLADRITARGVILLDERSLRTLSFSAGLLHNEPIGDVAPAVVAATGNALQLDAGFATQLAPKILLAVRYSAAYQFGQDGGLGSTLAHVFMVGVTASYSNSTRPRRALPSRGDRVDGSDGQGFEIVPDAR
jgi:hypothetical protein